MTAASKGSVGFTAGPAEVMARQADPSRWAQHDALVENAFEAIKGGWPMIAETAFAAADEAVYWSLKAARAALSKASPLVGGGQ